MDASPDLFVDPRTIAGTRRTYELTADEIGRARALASEIAGANEPVPMLAAYVHDRVRPAYGLSGYQRQPFSVLEDGRGDCFEASAVTAMLLRSLDVPCRLVTEICAARFEPGAALAALVPTAVAGPFTNSHVWLEAWTDDAWQPVDARFGVSGIQRWESARLQPRSGRFGFRFPLQLKSLDPHGAPDFDLSERYLLVPFAAARGTAAFEAWRADVAFFRDLRRGRRFLGIRLTLMLPRLRRMARNLEVLLAGR